MALFHLSAILGWIQGLFTFTSLLARYPTISVETLLGDGVTLDHLTDDCMGRTLDAIAEYGPTKLFNEIVVSTAPAD